MLAQLGVSALDFEVLLNVKIQLFFCVLQFELKLERLQVVAEIVNGFAMIFGIELFKCIELGFVLDVGAFEFVEFGVVLRSHLEHLDLQAVVLFGQVDHSFLVLVDLLVFCLFGFSIRLPLNIGQIQSELGFFLVHVSDLESFGGCDHVVDFLVLILELVILLLETFEGVVEVVFPEGGLDEGVLIFLELL